MGLFLKSANVTQVYILVKSLTWKNTTRTTSVVLYSNKRERLRQHFFNGIGFTRRRTSSTRRARKARVPVLSFATVTSHSFRITLPIKRLFSSIVCNIGRKVGN